MLGIPALPTSGPIFSVVDSNSRRRLRSPGNVEILENSLTRAATGVLSRSVGTGETPYEVPGCVNLDDMTKKYYLTPLVHCA